MSGGYKSKNIIFKNERMEKKEKKKEPQKVLQNIQEKRGKVI